MSNYRRNVLVGVTVLASMVMLGWMILRFGGSLGAPFAGKTMPVRFVTERADGRIVRCFARTPSLHDLVLFHDVFTGDVLTDFAFIEFSFGLSAAGVAM